MKTILLTYKPEEIPAASLDQIRALFPDRALLVTEDHAQIETHLGEIEIAAGNFPHDLLLRAPHLAWYQQWGAGADWLLKTPEAAEKEWTLVNASGVHAIPISEHILALMLAFARDLNGAFKMQQQHQWKKAARAGLFELAGKTLLLVGVGAIGERTALVAAALGMRVWGVRRDPGAAAAGVEVMFGPSSLRELLPQADFVVLTVPLTHETQGMIGEAELRAMKPSAYLINIGRGGTVQTGALVRALQEGWIAGAGLDVVAPEPLLADSPLWEMENVILTGHYAGLTPRYFERAFAIFLDNLRRYKAGQPLHNIVDKRLGY
jgi:phosphoglycerate dehydrogenase-like enzyme